jgi:hypothetical protein
MEKVEIIEYDGYLSLGLSPDQVTRIAQRANEKGLLGVEVDRGSIVFKYSGRDAGRWVIDFLREIAREVQDADGEIVCTLNNDDGDPSFEFYRVTNGKLLRQRGVILREPEENLS